jgi:hypothetical protein
MYEGSNTTMTEANSRNVIRQPIDDLTNGTPRTANETRPKNVSVSYVIKYRQATTVATNVASEVNSANSVNLVADKNNIGNGSTVNVMVGNVGKVIVSSTETTISNNLYATQEFTAVGYPRRNAIINGNAIVQQRTAVSLTTSTYQYGVDRFTGSTIGDTVSGTFQQISTAPVGVTGTAFAFSNVTITTNTNPGEIRLRTRLEAKDSVRFISKPATISLKIYHDIGSSKDITFYVRKATNTDVFSYVEGISTSSVNSVPDSTDTHISYTIPNMGDCSKGIEIEVRLDCGAISSKNIYFTEVQLENASRATDFEFVPYEQQLSMCQRYYESLSGGISVQGFCTVDGTNIESQYCEFSVEKRGNATMDLFIGTGGYYAHGYPGYGDQGGFYYFEEAQYVRVGVKGFLVIFRDADATKLYSGDSYYISFPWTAESEL